MPRNLLHKHFFIGWALLVFASNAVLGCTGEFALQTILRNEQTARIYAVVSSIIFLITVILYFLRKRKGLAILIVSILSLVFHPGWTRGAFAGDCGYDLVEMAKYFTAFLTLGLLTQLVLYFRDRSKKVS